MPDPKLPDFVLVKSTNPHREGQYGRAGLRFTREYRLLKLADAFNAELGEITAKELAILEKDSFLAVKPASAADVERLQAEIATTGGDKEATIDFLRKQNADLEARLMKLELAAQGGSKGKAGDADSKGAAKG
jgi:hypothetical protein